MQVSNRLKLVASFVSGEGTVADIGTDHGYIPIYLVKHHIANGCDCHGCSRWTIRKGKKAYQTA